MSIKEIKVHAKKSPQIPKKTPTQKTEDKLKVLRTKQSVENNPEKKRKLTEDISFENDKLRHEKSKRGLEGK